MLIKFTPAQIEGPTRRGVSEKAHTPCTKATKLALFES